MIERVVGHLAKHHPNVPIATIHDSVITTEGFADLVRAVMDAEFLKLGLPANIKEELLERPIDFRLPMRSAA
jgi:hypothetical protein